MVRRFGTIVETGHFTPRKAEPFDPFEICSSSASIYGHYGLSNQAWVAGARFLGRHAGSFPFEKPGDQPVPPLGPGPGAGEHAQGGGHQAGDLPRLDGDR